MFTLDARLQRDCYLVGALPLSTVLLMNDSTWPWLILVPQRDGVSEIFELDSDDRRTLIDESCVIAEWLCRHFRADKINVAALGNIVRQLHVHHVARFENDPAWPGPVWGVQAPVAYTEAELLRLREVLATLADLPGCRLDERFFASR